jgi:hypothetical protein
MVVIFLAGLIPILIGVSSGSGASSPVDLLDLRTSTQGADDLAAQPTTVPLVVLVTPGKGDPCVVDTAAQQRSPNKIDGGRQQKVPPPPAYCKQLAHRTYVVAATGQRPLDLLHELYPGDDVTLGQNAPMMVGTVTRPTPFNLSYALTSSVTIALVCALVAGIGWPLLRRGTSGTRRPATVPAYQPSYGHTMHATPPPSAADPAPAPIPRSTAARASTHAVAYAAHADGDAVASTFVDSHGGYVNVRGIVVWATLAAPDAVLEPGDPVHVRRRKP